MIPRNFTSLATAIKSVDCILSADSLPAHQAEYFGKPTFVAVPRSNEYWMPHGCFTERRWGLFHATSEFSAKLDGFFVDLSKTPHERVGVALELA